MGRDFGAPNEVFVTNRFFRALLVMLRRTLSSLIMQSFSTEGHMVGRDNRPLGKISVKEESVFLSLSLKGLWESTMWLLSFGRNPTLVKSTMGATTYRSKHGIPLL